MSSRYQAWLKFVFDHEVKDQQWYFDDNAPDFSASPAEATELLSQTFCRAGGDLLGYTDEQVGQGIWYLASSSASDFMLALSSQDVPLPARLEAINNIFHLYSDCFAKRCDETLGHLSEPGSALNAICYMFWDLCPITYLENVPGKLEMQNAILSVLERTLALEHKACQEGALHGLSEMAHWCPERVREIVEHFTQRSNVDERLLTYACGACEGNVL